MTSIKEALERIKRTALDAKPEDVPKALAHIVRLCIDADRTTVESGGARERIARIIDPKAFDQKLHASEGWRSSWVTTRQSDALAKADAILATGLVPDEAAIRADEREKCAKVVESLPNITWTRAENAERQAPTRSMQVVIAAAIRTGGSHEA